jgi:spermidine synthase
MAEKMSMAHRALPLLLAVSGAAGLVYEVLWARDFALVYGTTAEGAAVVLAAYFSGLALGSYLGGRNVPVRGLRRYAALEAGLAVSLSLYLLLRPGLPAASAWLAHVVPALLAPGSRPGLALLVLLLPTTLLGATLPAVTAVLSSRDDAGAGRLYAWNTLGGAAGALIAAPLLVRGLGMRGAYVVAIAANLTVAAVAFVLARRAGAGNVRSGVPPPPASAAPAAIAIAAVTGGVGLAAEVLWTRGLSGVLSNSIYSIAIVLGATLLGIVLGAALASLLLRRARGSPRRRLAIIEALLAIALVGSLLAMPALPATSLALIQRFGVVGPGAGFAVEAMLALLVILVPATLLGAAFPHVLATANLAEPARAMGQVLAANTAGGIVGALGAAFVLLPGLGLAWGTSLLALLCAGVAISLGAWGLGAASAAVVAVVAFTIPAVHVPWREQDAERLLYYRDGATATVMVTADAQGGKRLRTNGQYTLGGSAGLFLERREAHLPLLLHPAPRRMLALGVGTGDTAGAARAHPGLELEGVELVAEVLDAARQFAVENGGVLDDPGARFVVDDARSRLLAGSERYDVILSDLFLPWTAGTAALYALEFYELGRDHLNPGGLYCQWLPLHQLAVSDLEMIVATFTRAFPEVQLWVAYHRARTPLAALIGSATPIRTDAAALRARLADGRLARATARVGLDDAGNLAVLYVAGGQNLRAATAASLPITDDRPRLEFSAPAAYFRQQDLSLRALSWVAARLDPGRGPIDGVDAPAPVRGALLAAQLALLADDRPAELAAYARALSLAPGIAAIRQAMVAIARERQGAGDADTVRLIGEALARFAPGTPEAVAFAEN